MTNETATQITDTAAYLLTITAACQNGDWAALKTVRAEAGLSRTVTDAALIELRTAGLIRIEPQPFRHRLTDADRAAALVIGGEPRHLITTVTH